LEATLEDEIFFELAFDDFIADFTSILCEISSAGYFYVEGRNMGWRHLSGTLGLHAADAKAFIAKAFPQTNQWTLQGTYHPDEVTLRYQLFHHDAPTGETYTVRKGFLCRSTGDILSAPPGREEAR
jgi:hypothetical protein